MIRKKLNLYDFVEFTHYQDKWDVHTNFTLVFNIARYQVKFEFSPNQERTGFQFSLSIWPSISIGSDKYKYKKHREWILNAYQ